jgi:hypothetical protein
MEEKVVYVQCLGYYWFIFTAGLQSCHATVRTSTDKNTAVPGTINRNPKL